MNSVLEKIFVAWVAPKKAKIANFILFQNLLNINFDFH